MSKCVSVFHFDCDWFFFLLLLCAALNFVFTHIRCTLYVHMEFLEKKADHGRCFMSTTSKDKSTSYYTVNRYNGISWHSVALQVTPNTDNNKNILSVLFGTWFAVMNNRIRASFFFRCCCTSARIEWDNILHVQEAKKSEIQKNMLENMCRIWTNVQSKHTLNTHT